MSSVAVVLLLIAACTHAGWNVLGKRQHPSTAFFLAANLLGGLMLSPWVLSHAAVVRACPLEVWGWLALTGLFMAMYYAGLAGAYRSGDMGIAYPLARALPVLGVAGLRMIVTAGNGISPVALVGMALVVAGALILPLKSFRAPRGALTQRVTILLAVVTAVGTIGYSLIDDTALRILRAVPDLDASGVSRTIVYAFLEAVSSSLWLGAYVLSSAKRRAMGASILTDRTGLGRACLTGAGIYVTYTIVLVAMGFVRDVSYVVAFRQLSIPVGAWLSVLVLREPAPLPRVVGTITVFVGLVLTALG